LLHSSAGNISGKFLSSILSIFLISCEGDNE
jgi:hypothetical protein